jgi:hypothetical protein
VRRLDAALPPTTTSPAAASNSLYLPGAAGVDVAAIATLTRHSNAFNAASKASAYSNPITFFLRIPSRS